MSKILIGIYKIISPSNKIYIGQSVNIRRRISNYRNLKKTEKQYRLFNSFHKYGYENHKFEIVQLCEIDELNIYERYYQELYNVLEKNGLNCVLTKLNNSEKIFSYNRNKNNIVIKEILSNYKYKKISFKPVINTKTGKIYESIKCAALENNLSSSTLHRHLRENNIKCEFKFLNYETEKINAKTESNTLRKVIHIETGKIYDSIISAAIEFNIKAKTLSCQLNRKSKLCKFEFYDKTEQNNTTCS